MDYATDTNALGFAGNIYGRIGNPGMKRLTQNGTHPMDSAYATRLLESIPKRLLEEIVRACARIATIRAERLLRLLSE